MTDAEFVKHVGIQCADVDNGQRRFGDVLDHLCMNPAGLRDFVATQRLYTANAFNGSLQKQPINVVEVDRGAQCIRFFAERHDDKALSIHVSGSATNQSSVASSSLNDVTTESPSLVNSTSAQLAPLSGGYGPDQQAQSASIPRSFLQLSPRMSVR